MKVAFQLFFIPFFHWVGGHGEGVMYREREGSGKGMGWGELGEISSGKLVVIFSFISLLLAISLSLSVTFSVYISSLYLFLSLSLSHIKSEVGLITIIHTIVPRARKFKKPSDWHHWKYYFTQCLFFSRHQTSVSFSTVVYTVVKGKEQKLDG